MSGAAQGSSQTAKILAPKPEKEDESKDTQKPAATLEEDDEFEDFAVEDWEEEDSGHVQTHLWEESWDEDQEAGEEFSVQLKEELKKMESSKR